MKVNMFYFAQISEILGCNKEEISIRQDTSVKNLIDVLKERNPLLSKQSFQVAVNQTLVKSDVKLNEGDEVALLPPFAGG